MLLIKAPEPARAESKVSPAISTRTSWERPAFLACELAVLALVARDLWSHLAAIRQHVGLPFQVDYEEGNILNALVRISHGLTPYPDPHAMPNILNPYGPVAYYLLAIPVKLFGISFLGPRLVIVASMAAICCFLALAIARLGGSRMGGTLFGLLYAALALVQGWSAVLRVDLLALAFSTAGVWAFAAVGDWPSTIDQPPTTNLNRQSTIKNSLSFLISALLFTAALLVKYTYVAAPAACVLWLITRKQWRLAVRFAATMAASFVAVLAVATAATRGAILTHLFLTHADPFSWSVYLLRLTDVVARHRVLVALSGILLISNILRRRISLPALWLLLATLTAVTAGKLGSNWNHFLELPAVLCLCAGVGWTILIRTCVARVSDPCSPLTRTPLRPLAVAAAVAAAAWLALFAAAQRKLPYDPYRTVAECPQAYQYVKQHGGDRVLSENVGALVMAGKTVWVSNPFVYGQLVMRGGWPDALEPMVRAAQFDLIVTQWNYPAYPPFMSDGGERFSPGVVKAIAQNYRPVEKYECTDARVIFAKK